MKDKKKSGFSPSSHSTVDQSVVSDQSDLKKLVEQGSWPQVETLLLKQRSEKKVQAREINDLFKKAVRASRDGNLKEAALLHCRLLAMDPFHAEGLRNGSIVMRWLSAIGMANDWCKRYLEIRPDCPIGLNTYGTILNDIGDAKGALAAYEKSLKISPDRGEVNSNIAGIYHFYGDIDKAYIYSTKALQLLPDEKTILLDHLIFARRAFALQDIEGIDWFALISDMPTQSIRHIFLQTLVCCESIDDQLKQFSLQKHWSDGLPRDQKGGDYTVHSDFIRKRLSRGFRIKIGFISGDFREHSVARFIWPLFKYLSRDKFQLYGYSTSLCSQSWSNHFDGYSEKLTDVSQLDASELCKIIRSDEIDVLFDLTGFTRGSRTGVLASRCAPFQVAWLGYPGSTGLAEMDYLFTDAYMAPEHKQLTTEKMLLTAGSSICIESLEEIPISPILPSDLRGYLTFGSLNNPYKFNRSMLKRWAQVVSKVEGSRVILVRKEYSSAILRKNITRFMSDHGIAPDRIFFYDNKLAGRHYLDCYNEIDISLDTYPVTGGTTTLDALWMGVPVVSLIGAALHQRVSSAILRRAGCADLVACNNDEFLNIALSLSQDTARREYLRFNLRQQIKDSDLCNTEGFCLEFGRTMLNLIYSVTECSLVT